MSILEAVYPSVERDSLEGFEALTLAAGGLEAMFVPSLGMVAGSLRHAGEELLDRRAGLRAYRERGAVMGVPLLHPWANRLARDELIVAGHRVRLPGPPAVWRDEHGLPIHGLLGAHPGWSVHEADADGHAARLIARLDFAADPRLTAVFPFPHDLVLEAALSAGSLRIATTCGRPGRWRCRSRSAITRTSGSPVSPAPTGVYTCRSGATSSWMNSRYRPAAVARRVLWTSGSPTRASTTDTTPSKTAPCSPSQAAVARSA